MHFSSTGEYVRRERLPFAFYNFAVIPDGYIFKTLDNQGNDHLDNHQDYTLLITDKNFKIKSVGLPNPPQGKVLGGYHYLYTNNNTIKITHGYKDTIYQYNNSTDELKAKYVMDYNDKKLPERYSQAATRDEFQDAITSNDYYFFIGEYLETQRHNAFSLRSGSGPRSIIYMDKNTGNLQGGTFGKYDDANEYPSMSFPLAAFDDYFIAVHHLDKDDYLLGASSTLTDEDKMKIKNMKEDDNPVLVFYKMKDF